MAKIIRTVLDSLPFGDDQNDYGLHEKVSNKVPEGVSNKALYGDIVKIAWPSFVELMLTQLTSMADLMMVGRLGPWALTAVGLTTQPKFLLMTMFMAMNVGATAMVARYRGAGEQEKANNIMRQALMMTLLFALISSVLGYLREAHGYLHGSSGRGILKRRCGLSADPDAWFRVHGFDIHHYRSPSGCG